MLELRRGSSASALQSGGLRQAGDEERRVECDREGEVERPRPRLASGLGFCMLSVPALRRKLNPLKALVFPHVPPLPVPFIIRASSGQRPPKNRVEVSPLALSPSIPALCDGM